SFTVNPSNINRSTDQPNFQAVYTIVNQDTPSCPTREFTLLNTSADNYWSSPLNVSIPLTPGQSAQRTIEWNWYQAVPVTTGTYHVFKDLTDPLLPPTQGALPRATTKV